MVLSDLIAKRPFRTRNADEISDNNVLEVFIDPTSGATGPFDYNNEIIKGKMGTGKTMYLRANFLYFLYTLVPQLIEGNEVILPVYIKLSDFQNINSAKEIYNRIVVRIIEEILRTADRLQSAAELIAVHTGIRDCFCGVLANSQSKKEIYEKIEKLTAEQYVEQVTTDLRCKGTLSYGLLEACGEYGKTKYQEILKKDEPRIEDVIEAYDLLLKPISANLLILFDEVSSLHKCFFEEQGSISAFKTIMNQLRTLKFIRTKIAIYPHTLADILMETRYGDIILLEDDIYSEAMYSEFFTKVISLIEKYLEVAIDEHVKVEDVFDVSNENTLLLEQIVYASDGNMRRLVQLLDTSLDECYRRCRANEKVILQDVMNAIRKQAIAMQQLHQGTDLEFLNGLAAACKYRTTYRFFYPNKSPQLSKYSTKSEEQNIIKIQEQGTGRRGTVYWFDYAYCVLMDIPTHYQYGSERIARSRSKIEGTWITKVTLITDELMSQMMSLDKEEGTIAFLKPDHKMGFINNGVRDDIVFQAENVINCKEGTNFYKGQKVKYKPTNAGLTLIAYEIELF